MGSGWPSRSTAPSSYLASDGLGSAEVALNSSGSETASILYGPYGQARYTNGSMPGSYGFTGQHDDTALTGLDYYGARYYDPTLGQFASADTVLDGLNRYGYVGGNPETFTDPSGHVAQCEDEECGGGGWPIITGEDDGDKPIQTDGEEVAADEAGGGIQDRIELDELHEQRIDQDERVADYSGPGGIESLDELDDLRVQRLDESEREQEYREQEHRQQQHTQGNGNGDDGNGNGGNGGSGDGDNGGSNGGTVATLPPTYAAPLRVGQAILRCSNSV